MRCRFTLRGLLTCQYSAEKPELPELGTTNAPATAQHATSSPKKTPRREIGDERLTPPPPLGCVAGPKAGAHYCLHKRATESCCREDVHHPQQRPVVSVRRAPGEPTHQPPRGTRHMTERIWPGLDERQISRFSNRDSFGCGQQQDTWKALQAPPKAYRDFKQLHNLGAFSDHRSGFYRISSTKPMF